MLSKLREKTTGWIAVLIVGLLVVPFAFFGVENYFTQQIPTYVAKVGEQEIGQQEFRQRFEQYRAQMRRAMGENFDARQFEDPATKRRLLDQMIEEKLLSQAAEQRGVVVPARQLQEQILAIEAFQVDGRFDADRYRLLLASQNMSPQQFERQLRSDLTVQFLPRQIVETGFVTDAYLDRYLALRDQKRSFDYLLLAPPSADEVGAVDEAAIQAYYDAHPEQFMRAESVTIEYLQVQPSDLEVPVTVDEQTLRARYEEQRSRFVEPEARLASHILVSVPADADADAVRAAQEEAAAIAASAREGDDFAELATEHSDDFGSRSTGGDLGWIERGLLAPAFEDALFALEPGAVSDPVKTDDGWHVIQLRELREEKGQGFEQARAELEREYLEGERERAFSDVSGRLVDLVYRDPTTLNTASEELDMEIQRAGPFGRTGGEGIAADPAVVRAAFSEDVLVGGTVSDPVELADGSIAVVRVAAHQPAEPLPLEQVKEQVRAAAMGERIAEAAREAAEQAMAQLEAGGTLQAIADAEGGTVESVSGIGRNAANLEPGLVREAFALPAPQEGQPSLGLAELGGDRHALIALSAVAQGDPSAMDPAARTALRQQLGRAIAGVEARSLIEALRGQAEIVIAEERM